MESMESWYQDTLKVTRDWQNFWESRTSAMLDEFVKTQSFVQTMNKSLEVTLDARRTFDTMITRWAQTFGMVTKKDFDTLSQQGYDGNVRLEKIDLGLQEIRRLIERQNEVLGTLSAAPSATQPAASSKKRGDH